MRWTALALALAACMPDEAPPIDLDEAGRVVPGLGACYDMVTAAGGSRDQISLSVPNLMHAACAAGGMHQVVTLPDRRVSLGRERGRHLMDPCGGDIQPPGYRVDRTASGVGGVVTVDVTVDPGSTFERPYGDVHVLLEDIVWEDANGQQAMVPGPVEWTAEWSIAMFVDTSEPNRACAP